MMVETSTTQDIQRHRWSHLNHLQVGKYGEYFAKMRMVAAGWEVYSTEVDDRGIDFLIRTAPGRCLEVQVKTIRPPKSDYVFFSKETLGGDLAEIQERLRYYALCLVLLRDGQEPEIYLIPGTVWLEPNGVFVDKNYEGLKSKPEFGINLSKKNYDALRSYVFSDESLNVVIGEANHD